MRRQLLLATALFWAAAAGSACSELPPPDARMPEPAAGPVPPDPDQVQAADEVRELVRERTRAVRAAPRDGAAWLRLGMAYDAHQLFHQADRCYEVSVALSPADPKAWYHHARIRAELSQLTDAVAAMERSIALLGEFAPSHWRLGLWLLDLGRTDSAKAAFQRAVELDPDDDAGSVGLARVALERGEADRAATLLEAVLGKHPENGHARQLLGAAYRQQGRLEDAERELVRSQYSRPVWRDPWKVEVDSMGVSLLDRLERLRELVRTGRGGEAIPELEQLLVDHPTNIALLSTLTPAYVQSGMLERAQEINLVALRERPDHFRVHMNLSLLALQTGDPEAALIHADRAVQLNPVFADAHTQRGRLLVSAGRLPEAARALELALRYGEPRLSTSMTLARVLLQLGRPEQAVEVLEDAAEAFPTASDPLALLAAIRADLGRVEEARQAWRAARDLNHDPRSLQEIEARLLQVEEGGR